MSEPKPSETQIDFSEKIDYKPPAMAQGDFDIKTVKGKLTNVASDWVPPRKASNRGNDRQPRMRSSVKALKHTINTRNLTTNWFGKDQGDKFWVPSKKAIDSSSMRMLAAEEFPASAVEYKDADVFACGALPAQYCPPQREAIHHMHPPDLVDAMHPTSLKQHTKNK